MQVAFRTTCGRAIGFGHLRRCLTLAEELVRRGHEPVFWLSGDDSGLELAAEAKITARPVAGMEAALASSPVDWLVVDDYAVGDAELAQLRRHARLAVIDDLADRRLDVDLILNGNANAVELAYQAPRQLLGPRYTLLRAAFRGLGRRPEPPKLERVLVIMGGSDARGLTARVTRLCLEALPGVTVDAVLGPLASDGEMAADPRLRVHRSPGDLAALMTGADLAVSAGGQTNYELAAVGLPAISICVADNQRGNLEALSRAATLRALFADDAERLRRTLLELAHDQELRQKMSDAGRRLVDGLGAIRVTEALEGKNLDG